MRPWKSTIVLGILALLAWGALAVDRRPGGATDDGRLAPGFQAGAISEIVWTGRGGERRLARRDDGWWLGGGLGRADDGLVEAMLSAVEYARAERRGEVPAATLTAPRASLTAGALRVAIGANDPTGTGVYVSIDGRAAIADRHLGDALDVEAGALRAAWLADHLVDPRSITVGDTALARHGAGWTATSAGAASRADLTAIEALLHALPSARAARFLDGDSPASGPALAVDGRERARLGGPCPGHPAETLVRRSDGAILCFPAAALAPIAAAADPASLVARTIAPIAPVELQRIALSDGPRSLLFERDGAGWRIAAPAPGPAADAEVWRLLDALAAAPATALAGPPPPERPGPRIELTAGDGDRLLLAVVGRAGPDLVLRRDAEPGLFTAPAALAPLLDPDPARFRPAAPPAEPEKPLD